jgi:hypothetical protein
MENMNNILRFNKNNWTRTEVLEHKKHLKYPNYWNLEDSIKHWLLVFNKDVRNQDRTHKNTALTGRF